MLFSSNYLIRKNIGWIRFIIFGKRSLCLSIRLSRRSLLCHNRFLVLFRFLDRHYWVLWRFDIWLFIMTLFIFWTRFLLRILIFRRLLCNFWRNLSYVCILLVQLITCHILNFLFSVVFIGWLVYLLIILFETIVACYKFFWIIEALGFYHYFFLGNLVIFWNLFNFGHFEMEGSMRDVRSWCFVSLLDKLNRCYNQICPTADLPTIS